VTPPSPLNFAGGREKKRPGSLLRAAGYMRIASLALVNFTYWFSRLKTVPSAGSTALIGSIWFGRETTGSSSTDVAARAPVLTAAGPVPPAILEDA
jgi:hypothetical protein